MNLEDTIVAISSPPGAARRGIVRLSGPRAVDIAGEILSTEAGLPTAAHGNSFVAGHITTGGCPMPAHGLFFFAPRSYTRQDIVELHLLGAPVVLGLVVEACLTAGARRAEAGEFTARAFLGGAMDLAQVHGVAGMIAARSDQQLKAAERLLHGDLGCMAHAAREELADLLSLVEGAMDFADEPIEFIAPGELKQRLDRVQEALAATIAAGLNAERWGRLPRVVLAGRPNAGKSSLLNRLTELDRAICTAIAGTTRDAITAPLVMGDGMECLLVDVAGVEDVGDELTQRAQKAARAAMTDADVILEVIDATSPQASRIAIPAGRERIVAINKCDLGSRFDEAALRRIIGIAEGDAVCFVSAKTGAGEAELRGRIAECLKGRREDANEASIALMAEHRHQLQTAIESVSAARQLAAKAGETLLSAELVAAELRMAADALGVLVGQDQLDEMLGRIFSRFCVGK